MSRYSNIITEYIQQAFQAQHMDVTKYQLYVHTLMVTGFVYSLHCLDVSVFCVDIAGILSAVSLCVLLRL